MCDAVAGPVRRVLSLKPGSIPSAVASWKEVSLILGQVVGHACAGPLTLWTAVRAGSCIVELGLQGV